MNSFLKNLLARKLPAGYPAAEADLEAPLLDEHMLESVKAAVDRYMQETSAAANPPFSDVRQAGMVLEASSLPPASPVQLYSELQSALGLLQFVPGARAKRACEEIELYMDKLRTAVQSRDSIK